MLSRVAGQPAGEICILPAPTQEKEEDLTNSICTPAVYVALAPLIVQIKCANKRCLTTIVLSEFDCCSHQNISRERRSNVVAVHRDLPY